MIAFSALILLFCVLIVVWLAFKFKRKAPEFSNIKSDENLVFFRTSAWLDTATRSWHIPIHAWVYEPENSRFRAGLFKKILKKKYELESSNQHPHLSDRINLLISDNERGKRLVIDLEGRKFVTPPSEPNGHIYTVITLPEESIKGDSICYHAALKSGDSRIFKGESDLISPTGESVISDIDDTVKITHVTDRKKMMEHTFLKDFAPVPGMADLYRHWQSTGRTFFFVSSSPWYLYQPLMQFLKESNFPPATLSLKAFRFRDKSLLELFKKGTETKPPAIKAILNAYPTRSFTLVGDSGEQDAEVYKAIAEEFPSQIQHIYIRNIDGSEKTQKRIERIFKDLPNAQWQVFSNANEIKK